MKRILMAVFLFCNLWGVEKIDCFGELDFFNNTLTLADLVNKYGGYEKKKILIIEEYDFLFPKNVHITYTVIENDSLICGVHATFYKRNGEFIKTFKKTKWNTNEGIELGDSLSKIISIYGKPRKVEKSDSLNFDVKYIYFYESDENLISELEFSGDTLVGINIWYGP